MRDAEFDDVAGFDPPAGRGEQRADAARQAREHVGGADVGEEADADLGHGEQAALADDAMRSVGEQAHPAAHDDAVDQRYARLGIARDAAVEPVFLAPEVELGGVVARPPQFVEQADVAAGAEGAAAGAGDDDPGDARVALEIVERGGDRAHHRQRQRVERARSIEEDEAGRAAAFGVNRRIVARRGGFCHFTFANAASMAAATSAIAAMPSTSCNAPLAA